MLRNHLKFLLINQKRCFSAPVVATKEDTKKQSPLITCKRPEFNLYYGDHVRNTSAKFSTIPLASNGWKHQKSKGDSFTIHPIHELQVDDSKNVVKSFERLGLESAICDSISKNFDIKEPTNIQIKAIPEILNGEHTLLAAETGCGKTYCYLLPIIQQIIETKKKIGERNFNCPLGLILTPGRELATQIGNAAEKICDDVGIKTKVILGGNTKQLILNPTFDDVDLLIGTMGATSKLVTTGIYRMNHTRHVVLDEADTLLDDSFNEKLAYFLRRFPFYKNEIKNLSDRIVGAQLILVSATMPTNVKELLQEIIDLNSVREITSANLHRVVPNITQKFLRMNKSDRPSQLLKLVKSQLSMKRPLIIFGNKSVTSDFISIFLNDHHVNCVNLNGDMLMKIRVGQFEKFQSGEVNVLSTTDVGSRGLDTTRARHIINFDFPLHVADYIHRCGRIGRVGSASNCKVTNFVSSLREIDLVQRIEHAARTMSVLPNVNANITNIIKTKIMKEIEKEYRRL